MGNQKYSKPGMRIVCFKPQVCAEVCEFYLDGIDPINSTQIGSHTKFWIDSGEQGVIDGTDFDSNYTHQTDGAGWGDANTIVKAWWADKPKYAEDVFSDHSKFAEYQTLGYVGYMDVVGILSAIE